MAASVINTINALNPSISSSSSSLSIRSREIPTRRRQVQLERNNKSKSKSSSSLFPSSVVVVPLDSSFAVQQRPHHVFLTHIVSCLPSSSSSSSSTPRTRFNPSTRLFVSGLSFRTTEESLTNAFKNFGQLVEVNLVMDKIANRPRGFAFLCYATEEESKKAIEGMHGKFLDGRVIFVEIAKSKSELRQSPKENSRQ